ncbi:MAG: WbuC family cupin fold metalloprotein [Cyanobacteria bacterium P01_A01_bin.123]
MLNLSNQKKQSPEVYLSSEPSFSLNQNSILELKQAASLNPRQRVRFCAHASAQEIVHEMVIVHPKNAYVRPHKHLNKPESMLVIEGSVDYIIFNNDGGIKEIISMGDYRSGKPFYQSIREAIYHTLIIQSEWLVFLEITKGPFQREDTVFADWSPVDSDINDVETFLNQFRKI